MPALAECEIFNTWTKESRRFQLHPTQEEQVKCLPPAGMNIYFGQTAEAVFVTFSGVLKFTRVSKSQGPGQEPQQIDKMDPAVETGKEVLTVESTFQNEILRESL